MNPREFYWQGQIARLDLWVHYYLRFSNNYKYINNNVRLSSKPFLMCLVVWIQTQINIFSFIIGSFFSSCAQLFTWFQTHLTLLHVLI